MKLNSFVSLSKRWSWPAALVVVAIAGYTLVMSYFTIGRAANYTAGWYDLGIMSQTVWRVGHGFGFTFTNPEAGLGGVHGLETIRTAIHTDYFLILLAPLSWFGQTWQNILVLQALVVAIGAWFVYRLGRRLLGQAWLGVLLAAVYLAYSPLQFANLFEFHAVTLAVTFCLAAADAIVASRYRLVWLWIGLALITKEQVGLSLALLTWFLWWRQGERRRAWWAAAICLGWTVLQLGVVVPLSRPHQSASFVSGKFYGAQEGSLAVVQRLVDVPGAWRRLNTPTHRSDLVQLLVPLGGPLPLLSPLTYLLLPELLLYWLSDSPNQQTLFLHYQALWIPFLLLGTMLAWGTIVGWAKRIRPGLGRWATVGLVVVVLVGTGWGIRRVSPWPWSAFSRWNLISWKEHQAPQVVEALRLIPPRATVAVTQNLGPQVSGRPRVTLLPTGAATEEYLMILQRSFDPNSKTNDKRYAERDMLDQLLAWVQAQPAAFRVQYHSGRVWLIQRIGQPTQPVPVWPDHLLGQ